MGTLLFVLLRAILDLHTPYDAYWLCLLVALEGPGYLRVWIYLRRP